MPGAVARQASVGSKTRSHEQDKPKVKFSDGQPQARDGVVHTLNLREFVLRPRGHTSKI